MSKSSKRRATRKRQAEARTLASHRVPCIQSLMVEGVGETPDAHSIREDIALAKAMLAGGWDTPPDKLLKLLSRLCEASDPRIDLKIALQAISVFTNLYKAKCSAESDRAKLHEIEKLGERIKRELSDCLPTQG